MKNILYIIGGSTAAQNVNTVWAYSPKTKTWTEKTAMPTIRAWLGVVVEKNIIYAVGGLSADNCCQVDTVESYNPATDTWTEETPLSLAKEGSSLGLVGKTILAAGGYSGGANTGDNEGYDATTNTWTALTSDPGAKSFACAGSIGTELYAVSGWTGGEGALTTTESFKLSKQTWTTTLAPIPQPAIAPGSAVYKGQLYCFGGWASWGGNALNNVQIYQP